MVTLSRLPLMGAVDRATLVWLVASLGEPVVVEIGSWLGGGAKLMRAAGARRVYAVDAFDGGGHDPADALSGLVSTEDHRQAFRANVGDDPDIVAVIADSCAAVIPHDGPVDMVFIDADHRYEAVRADINRWSRIVRAGGIVAGHDYDPAWPGVVRAVDETGGLAGLGGSVWWRIAR